MKKKRIRNIPLHIMLSEKELKQINERMADAGTDNRSAFIRKMLLDGYAVHVDISPVKELIFLQRRCVNNLKQIAKHTNARGVYAEEVAALQKGYEDMWGKVSETLNCITKIVEL